MEADGNQTDDDTDTGLEMSEPGHMPIVIDDTMACSAFVAATKARLKRDSDYGRQYCEHRDKGQRLNRPPQRGLQRMKGDV